ncbi:MAG TPA: anti-sigma factor [Pseudonocardiaceae bacterium]|jgi:anti-sigma-K factor RskA|nr:anti-sigma factor [Pseudonocardiaceae bacterium]
MNADVHALTGAYVLDAIEDDERADYERHIEECAECAREVAEFRATAARLGAVAAISPPTQLHDRVRHEVARTRQDSPGRLRLVGAAADSGRRIRYRRRMWTVSAAAVVAFLAAGVSVGFAINAGHQLDITQHALSQAHASDAPISRLLAAPDVRMAGGSANGGSVTLLSSPSLHQGVLLAQNLPAQPHDRNYQAWTITPAGFRSLGLLGGGGSATLSVPDLGTGEDIGVTVEPAGGSSQPTTAPIMDFRTAG